MLVLNAKGLNNWIRFASISWHMFDLLVKKWSYSDTDSKACIFVSQLTLIQMMDRLGLFSGITSWRGTLSPFIWSRWCNNVSLLNSIGGYEPCRLLPMSESFLRLVLRLWQKIWRDIWWISCRLNNICGLGSLKSTCLFIACPTALMIILYKRAKFMSRYSSRGCPCNYVHVLWWLSNIVSPGILLWKIIQKFDNCLRFQSFNYQVFGTRCQLF